MNDFPYRTPDAFRAALTDRLKQQARRDGRTMQQLARQFAYDRFLARIFTGKDAQQWVLKGGGALLARLSQARHTIDLDLYRTDTSPVTAEKALREAAGRDLGDFFVFEVDSGKPISDSTGGARFVIISRVGQRHFENFTVDLVSGSLMTGTPDEAEPMVNLDLAGLLTTPYRLYPLCRPHRRQTGRNARNPPGAGQYIGSVEIQRPSGFGNDRGHPNRAS